MWGEWLSGLLILNSRARQVHSPSKGYSEQLQPFFGAEPGKPIAEWKREKRRRPRMCKPGSFPQLIHQSSYFSSLERAESDGWKEVRYLTPIEVSAHGREHQERE